MSGRPEHILEREPEVAGDALARFRVGRPQPAPPGIHRVRGDTQVLGESPFAQLTPREGFAQEFRDRSARQLVIHSTGSIGDGEHVAAKTGCITSEQSDIVPLR